jgi:large subunit ribosomal protein L21
MSIVIQSGSKQYIVDYGQKLFVDRLDAKENENVNLTVVYSFGDTKSLATVTAKVIKHDKDPKIRVVKYKSKSNYHRQYGYRHYNTLIEILKPE